MTKMEDEKTEDDQTGRQPKWKTTKMEKRPKRKTTEIELMKN